MESYKIFTKETIKKIEELLLYKAIPLALEDIANRLETTGEVINKQDILNNLPLLASRGLQKLRRMGQEKKQIYELFHGCILATFLNGIEPNFQHDVCYPEDDSYDFLIIKYPRDRIPDFKTLQNKEIYKNGIVFKMELVELTKLENLKKIIADKFKYKERILLISIAFNGQINFQDFFDRVSIANKNNFETIWLIGQINHPEDKNKLCYFIAETVKHKQIFPLFELLIDWSEITNEVNKALTH